MYLRSFAIALLLGLTPLSVISQTTAVPQTAEVGLLPARITALSETMMLDGIIAVMRDEGLDYGKTLDRELMGGAGGSRWLDVVTGIYDAPAMRSRFDAALTQHFSAQAEEADSDLPSIEAFFGSAQGQTILRLEIEARRALLDKPTEDAAKVTWEDLKATDDPRVAMLMRFVAANDLIESNVMGALNSNLAFYRGMGDSGAFPQDMTEEEMLQDVWRQEPDIRAETEEWLFPYLALAYQPLSDADLEAYIAFSETPAGKRMNVALFAAFDAVFTKISYDLGLAAAKQMQGEDI